MVLNLVSELTFARWNTGSDAFHINQQSLFFLIHEPALISDIFVFSGWRRHEPSYSVSDWLTQMFLL